MISYHIKDFDKYFIERLNRKSQIEIKENDMWILHRAATYSMIELLHSHFPTTITFNYKHDKWWLALSSNKQTKYDYYKSLFEKRTTRET